MIFWSIAIFLTSLMFAHFRTISDGLWEIMIRRIRIEQNPSMVHWEKTARKHQLRRKIASIEKNHGVSLTKD